MKTNVQLIGFDRLEKKLSQLNNFRLEAVIIKNTTELLNYMKSHTPRDTNWLANNIFADPKNGIMGYTTEYAPHVEYGHRQEVGRYVPVLGKRLKNAYVPGQHFLRKGVLHQKPIYRQDLINAIEKEGG